MRCADGSVPSPTAGKKKSCLRVANNAFYSTPVFMGAYLAAGSVLGLWMPD